MTDALTNASAEEMEEAIARATLFLMNMLGTDLTVHQKLDMVVAIHETVMASATPALHLRADDLRERLRDALRAARKRLGPPPGRKMAD